MRFWYALAALALFGMIPGVQACSLAYQQGTWADLSGDTLATHIGEDVVKIDLKTGKQTVLVQHFFPRAQIEDGRIAMRWQEGLGADCTGDIKFRVVGGMQMDDVFSFDMAGDLLVTHKDDKLRVYDLVANKLTASYAHILVPENPYSTPRAVVAISDDGRVAASKSDSIELYAPRATIMLAQIEALDWHGDRLIAATGNDDKATFHIIGDDVQTINATSDYWAQPQIAAGKDLYLAFGSTVYWIQDAGVERLVVPSAYDIGAIGADDQGAVLIALERTEWGRGDIAGIQRFDSSFGQWREADDWSVASKPAWRWHAGPALQDGGPLHGEESPGVPGLLVLVSLVALALRRRP